MPALERVLFPALSVLGASWEVLAVDDGSRDGTGGMLLEMASRNPGMRVLSRTEGRGLGASLREGLAASRGDWVVPLDADMSFHPGQIRLLLEAQGRTGADCVCGSPFLGDMSAVPWTRRLPSLVMNAFYRGLFEPSLSAYTPMFRLYRASALKALPLDSDGFEISAEILARILKAGFKVVDVPVGLEERRSGLSKLRRWRELKSHLRLLCRLLRGA